MDSRIVQDMEIVEREACYLIDTIETTLERIVNYNDLNEQEIKSIKEYGNYDAPRMELAQPRRKQR
jgi:hypothetical protein